MQRNTFFLILLALFLASAVSGQGLIRGKVSDLQTGEPLIAANVLVQGTAIGSATDANGVYHLRNLEPGTYTLRASYIGYQSITISNVRVSTDLTTEIDFGLPPEGIEVGTVEIVADKPLVVKDNTNKVRITTSEDIEALPVRGVNNIIGLSAGVVLQDNNVFIRGGRLDEVGYYLEGVSVNDPMTGGNAVNVVQDAVEEIQVQAGGYTAEFGGANAGIIRQQLKTGSTEIKAAVEYITDNIGFEGSSSDYSGDERLGAYWYGYNEFTASVGGPFFSNKLRFFGLVNYSFQRDANPQPYPGIDLGLISDPVSGDEINLLYRPGPVKGNSAENYTYTGTFNLNFNPFIIKLAGTYSENDGMRAFNTHRNAGNISNILNEARIERQDFRNGTGSIKLTHILSPTMFYEVSGGYFYQTRDLYDPYLKDDYQNYGDSLANAEFGFQYKDRYTRPDRVDIYDFSFNGYGDLLAGYLKAKREHITGNVAFSLLLDDVHSIKFGGDYEYHTIRNFSFNNERVFSLAKLVDDPQGRTLAEINAAQGVNAYGYDLEGNETNEDGIFAPKHPVFASAYVQDKIDFEDIILNLGLRYDYIDVDNFEFVDPAMPDLTFDFNSGAVKEEGLKQVPSFNAISPRIGISFPVTDLTVFHAQYGKFVQQTRLNDIYQGLTATADQMVGGLFINTPVGFNIRPTRTTQYEIGFTQQVGDFASFDITGYYKDIKDQVVLDLQRTDKNSQFKSYNIYRNGDFATTKGIEITFNMRRTSRIAANASVSFQDARGTGSFPNSNRGIVGAPLDGVTIFTPQYISPLSFNNSFRGNMNFDYRFGDNDGPKLLHNFGISLLAQFSNGHPFTRGIGGADLEGDARDRRPVEPLNSSVTPSTLQVDLKVDKSFRLFDRVNLNVYAFVINLFDRNNVENVFLRTGSASDDGYISDPQLSGELASNPEYVELYNAINVDYYERYQNAPALFTVPYLYGPPRQIRLGIRLEY